jgi:splicing factor 3B subunit 2
MSTATDRKLTKNEKKRLKKKSEKHEVRPNYNGNSSHKGFEPQKENYGIEIEYVAPEISELGIDEELFSQFQNVFQKFAKPEELLTDRPRHTEENVNGDQQSFSLSAEQSNKENQLQDINQSENKKLSKKKKKMLSRLSVSELKQLVPRPDVVEAHDVTSLDPRLLIHLKAYRNSVPVPRHWCHVRRYLQGKRGIEKVPYQLPEYIAETGIAKIRETVLEQEAMKKGKQKAREKIRPKMGKIDIDYQVLHDAFFKYQIKPKMTRHGDLYYESKEFEVSNEYKIFFSFYL